MDGSNLLLPFCEDGRCSCDPCRVLIACHGILIARRTDELMCKSGDLGCQTDRNSQNRQIETMLQFGYAGFGDM